MTEEGLRKRRWHVVRTTVAGFLKETAVLSFVFLLLEDVFRNQRQSGVSTSLIALTITVVCLAAAIWVEWRSLNGNADRDD